MVVGELDQVDDSGSHESVGITSKIEKLEDQFNKLQTSIIDELSAKPGITVQKLLSQLTQLPLSLRREYESSIEKRISSMSTVTQINNLFIIHLNPLTSFMDYGLTEYVIKKFGSDNLKRDMRSYCSEMVVFMKETTIKQLINYFPGQPEIPPKFSLIETKIGEDVSKCTLEQLNTIRRRYCSEVKLSEIVFHLVAVVESNSFIVRWLVPSVLVCRIVQFTKFIDQIFYQECKITSLSLVLVHEKDQGAWGQGCKIISLTLDGMWLFLSEAEINAMWSQVHVSDTKSKDQFQTMCKQMLHQLEVGKISEHQLSLHIAESLKCQQHVSIHLSQAILKYEIPASFVDFRVLTTVIERFGNDCLKRFYYKYITTIAKKSTVQQLIDLPSGQSKPLKYFVVAKCKIMEEPSLFGVENLLLLQSDFCSILDVDEICFIMDEVNTETKGSFTVSWLVPSPLISHIMKSASNIPYQKYKITTFILDSMWLYISESDIVTLWSHVHVSDAKFKDQFYNMYKQILFEMKIKISEHQLSLYLSNQLPNSLSNVSQHLHKAFLDKKTLSVH